MAEVIMVPSTTQWLDCSLSFLTFNWWLEIACFHCTTASTMQSKMWFSYTSLIPRTTVQHTIQYDSWNKSLESKKKKHWLIRDVKRWNYFKNFRPASVAIKISSTALIIDEHKQFCFLETFIQPEKQHRRKTRSDLAAENPRVQ